MIIGRNSELKYLNTYYDRTGSQIMVVYGEKNVGKTALVRQFAQDKPNYYFRARSASEREQCSQWKNELENENVKLSVKLPKSPSFLDIFKSLLPKREQTSGEDTGRTVMGQQAQKADSLATDQMASGTLNLAADQMASGIGSMAADQMASGTGIPVAVRQAEGTEGLAEEKGTGRSATDQRVESPEIHVLAEDTEKLMGIEDVETPTGGEGTKTSPYTPPCIKKVIIIDEFQYIVKSGSQFMESAVKLIHGLPKGIEVMFILCSSSIGWVENGMIAKLGDTAYELSGLLKVKELGFDTMMEFFPGFSREQGIEAYAVLGGMPGFWKQFDDKSGIKENICRYILNKDSSLYEEGQRIVERELREMGVYNTILAAMAAGHNKLNDLYLQTGFSRAKISVYLKNLIELELVEKVFSYDTEGKANTQKGIYRISNHFVHFYFTFLYPNLSSLETLTPGEFYNKYIGLTFKNYVANYFRTICRQCIERWNKWGRLPFKVNRIGEWVGKFGNIDVVAQGEGEKTLISVCNWERPVMRYDDYEWLLFCAEKAKLKADYVYLFSIQRFDEKLNLEARIKHNLKLISLDDM